LAKATLKKRVPPIWEYILVYSSIISEKFHSRIKKYITTISFPKLACSLNMVRAGVQSVRRRFLAVDNLAPSQLGPRGTCEKNGIRTGFFF